MRRFKFAWWNTGLSPLCKDRATSNDKDFAFEVIYYLLRVVRVNCLALGEILSEDIANFLLKHEFGEYTYYDGNKKIGRLQFDTCFIYRKEELSLAHDEVIINSHGRKNFKVANYLTFRSRLFSKSLDIFISHWPSRMTYGKDSIERILIAHQLRDKIDEINKKHNNCSYIVLLGDYNDEPFDKPLSEILLASRDRQLVRKEKTLLYNPFWRRLGEYEPHTPGKKIDCYSGTCFYSSGNETEWRTFDQIIFSSHFLGYNDWQLDEEDTLILQFDNCRSNNKSIFDHFPVISVISKKGIF